VLVHGMGGQPWEQEERRKVDVDEFIDGFADLSTVLAVAGYGVVRFLAYETRPQEGTRNWRQATLRTYADDLDAVVAQVKDEWPDRKVFIAGHSYGAVATVVSQAQQFDGAILYDPASFTNDRMTVENWIWSEDLQLCYFHDDPEWVATKERIDVEQSTDVDKCYVSFDKPMHIVLASEAHYFGPNVEYFARLGLKNVHVVDGAPHNFASYRDVLALHTLDWLDTVQ
jgi:pimeloyl-ACP methyl ester carboxylesterase